MNEGLNSLQAFNPIDSSPELLERMLIGRKTIIDMLEKLVIESATSGNKIQRLIIGPRGSGKTHLLHVLYNRMVSRTELRDKLKIAYLCEDEYGIAAFLDLIIRILRSFVKWDPEKSGYLNGEIDKLKKVPPDDQEKIAVKTLIRHIEGTTLLVIVENIGNIFNALKIEGQRKLRDLVQQYPIFTFMASNEVFFKDVQYEDKPFHNFFTTTYLKPLTPDESLLFLKSIAEWEHDKDLLEFFNTTEGIGKIHAIYDITSGNHRLMVTFYNFLKAGYKSNFSQVFLTAINQLIPYYQGFIDKLSPLQQKIIQFLSQNRKASSVKEIAENCFSAQNTISKQMILLVKLKYVDSTSVGKETFYEIAEPLLRICLEVKENRSRPIKLFMDFLGNLYSTEEIKNKYMHFSQHKNKSKNNAGELIMKDLEENLTSLFINELPQDIAAHLNESLTGLEKDGYTEYFFNLMPHVIFNLLVQHEKIETLRFEFIGNILKEMFQKNEAMIIPLKFLDIGVRHLKKKEKNVLLWFPKEERNTFTKFVLEILSLKK